MVTVDLTGKVAVVTGAGSGLGAALARIFAAAGMGVAALDINEQGAQETAAALAEEFKVPTMAVRVDVGDAGSVAAAAEQVRSTLGGCDVLCANVGVQQFGSVDHLTEQDWEWVLGVNVLGTVRTVREFLPLLRAGVGWRRVMLSASANALVPSVSLAAYQASKFAVVGFGETLRQELAAEEIGVTVLFPDAMMTDHLGSSARARPERLGESTFDPADIDVMLAQREFNPDDVVTPDHAVRNVLADLIDNVPYSLTHGSYRAVYNKRRDALEAAFDRMESA
jgi:NAD(P)-dependent dehydrogenase (short-subunit alcohol dehydrogenase family)